jgi:hypothetical protein
LEDKGDWPKRPAAYFGLAAHWAIDCVDAGRVVEAVPPVTRVCRRRGEEERGGRNGCNNELPHCDVSSLGVQEVEISVRVYCSTIAILAGRVVAKCEGVHKELCVMREVALQPQLKSMIVTSGNPSRKHPDIVRVEGYQVGAISAGKPAEHLFEAKEDCRMR